MSNFDDEIYKKNTCRSGVNSVVKRAYIVHTPLPWRQANVYIYTRYDIRERALLKIRKLERLRRLLRDIIEV